MSEKKPFATGGPHPDEWRRDLNPEAGAGLNYGTRGVEQEKDVHTGYDIKSLGELYQNLSSAELKSLPILAPGTRLQQGATYLDLRTPGSEFTAQANMEATADHLYVAKSEVDYQLWNKLLGKTNPGDTEEKSNP